MKINRHESKPTVVALNSRLLILLFFLSCFLFPHPIHAQTISLSIYPPILEAVLKPNQSYTQNYQLKNQGDDITIHASLVPFQPNDQLGHITLNPTNYQSPALNYFTLNQSALPQSFTLKAGTTKNLSLTISIPLAASPSDHYLTLLFQSEAKALITGTGSKTLPSIGSNILLTIPASNQPQSSLQINQFSSQEPLFDSFDTIDFTILAHNPSDHYLKTVGQINIFNLFNQKVATIPLRSDNILKQSTRQLIANNPWNPLFPFGRYKAIVTLTPVNTTNTINQTISFWIIPYKLILALTLIFLVFKAQSFKFISKFLPHHS